MESLWKNGTTAPNLTIQEAIRRDYDVSSGNRIRILAFDPRKSKDISRLADENTAPNIVAFRYDFQDLIHFTYNRILVGKDLNNDAAKYAFDSNQIWAFIVAQWHGHSGPLQADGHGNIFFIKSDDGVTRAECVFRQNAHWHRIAYELDEKTYWFAGSRVFRNRSQP